MSLSSSYRDLHLGLSPKPLCLGYHLGSIPAPIPLMSSTPVQTVCSQGVDRPLTNPSVDLFSPHGPGQVPAEAGVLTALPLAEPLLGSCEWDSLQNARPKAEQVLGWR
jgi:hypothetical protein